MHWFYILMALFFIIWIVPILASLQCQYDIEEKSWCEANCCFPFIRNWFKKKRQATNKYYTYSRTDFLRQS